MTVFAEKSLLVWKISWNNNNFRVCVIPCSPQRIREKSQAMSLLLENTFSFIKRRSELSRQEAESHVP